MIQNSDYLENNNLTACAYRKWLIGELRAAEQTSEQFNDNVDYNTARVMLILRSQMHDIMSRLYELDNGKS